MTIHTIPPPPSGGNGFVETGVFFYRANPRLLSIDECTIARALPSALGCDQWTTKSISPPTAGKKICLF